MRTATDTANITNATATDIALQKQLRTAWGLGLMVLWIGFWWFQLDAQRRAALALPCPDNFMHKLGDFFAGGAGKSCKNEIDSQFWSSLMGYVFLSPLAFVVSHYIARWRVQMMAAAKDAEAARQERERQQSMNAAMQEIGAKHEIEDARSRRSNDRYELITRLGAVDDQLLVLAGEQDAERIKLIQLNLLQALRDIHAKFTGEELRALSAADASIQTRVARTMAEMRRLNLEGSRAYDDLHSLFGEAAEAEAPSPPQQQAQG